MNYLVIKFASLACYAVVTALAASDIRIASEVHRKSNFHLCCTDNVTCYTAVKYRHRQPSIGSFRLIQNLLPLLYSLKCLPFTLGILLVRLVDEAEAVPVLPRCVIRYV